MAEARSYENKKLIAEFEKNASETVRVHIQTWNDRAYVDVRAWTKDEKGEPVATKKGITLSAELLGELRSAIDKAISAIELGDQGIPATDDADGAEIPF